jgi:acetate kinase
MRVLVVNAGSSSLKLRLLDAGEALEASRDVSGDGGRFDDAEIASAVGDMAGDQSRVDAVGHRVVHGGTRYTSAVVLDAEVRAALDQLSDLAPLHQPKSLAGIDAVSAALPGVPAVACFDTGFHATLPAAAATYPLPAEWRSGYEVRRYGFHGLSHAYASRRAAELLGREVAGLRVVTCHLGAGASLAAVHSGRSVDTTMGFTPLEGLAMATRSGSVDPGLVLWLQQRHGLSADEVADGLEHRSGMAGLAGTPDLREVIDRAGRAEPDARLALDVYVHRLVGGIAAMVASLGGLDALVFTGGVGENAPTVRGLAAQALGFLGVAVNPERNAAASGDAEIGASGAPVSTLVVAAREDLEIARQVRALLAASPTLSGP